MIRTPTKMQNGEIAEKLEFSARVPEHMRSRIQKVADAPDR